MYKYASLVPLGRASAKPKPLSRACFYSLSEPDKCPSVIDWLDDVGVIDITAATWQSREIRL